MKSVLVIGLGDFGQMLCENLNKLGHQVMAVDCNEEKVNAVLHYVTDAQIGDSTNEQFLKSLGVPDFDLCIVTISQDFQSSLETTYLLKELGAKKVISRSDRKVQKNILIRNGADEVIHPKEQIAQWAAVCYTADGIFDYMPLSGDVAVFEVIVPEEWEGKNVEELKVRKKYGINVLALKEEDGTTTLVQVDTVMHTGEKLIVLGKLSAVNKCFDI